MDEPAQGGRPAAKDWPEDRIDGQLRANVGERKGPLDGTGSVYTGAFTFPPP